MSLTRVPSGLLDTANTAINAFIPTPGNGTIMLVTYAPYSGNVIATVTQCTIGTATASWNIGTSALNNVNTISTTTNNSPQITNTKFSAGANISLFLSNVSPTCANVGITILVTRSGP